MKVGQLDVLYSIKVEIIYSDIIYLVNPVQSKHDAYMIQKIDYGTNGVFKNVILAI